MDSFDVEMVHSYHDKDRNVLKFLFQIWLQLKIGEPYHENECPPTILIQTKPFIVSTKLSKISLFHKAFMRLYMICQLL